jgi:hypothetical protein
MTDILAPDINRAHWVVIRSQDSVSYAYLEPHRLIEIFVIDCNFIDIMEIRLYLRKCSVDYKVGNRLVSNTE